MNSNAPTPSAWSALDHIRALVTFPCYWQDFAGDDFPALKLLCLQPSSFMPLSYPCPHHCGCWHKIIPPLSTVTQQPPDFPLIGHCQCEPPACPDLHLTRADVVPLEVNRTRLGRNVCQALGLNSKPLELPIPFTAQIGSWSADAVPAILTLHSDPSIFREVVTGLVARLRHPFILLAPTARHMDVDCFELLATVGAAFLSLETCLSLGEDGTLHARVTPGDLFAQFRPEPKEDVDQDMARKIIAVIHCLESETPPKPPTVHNVFYEYCVLCLTAQQIGRKYHCSKATVIGRLNLIRLRTGMDPEDLRRLSPYFSELEDKITDSRAPHITRRRLVRDDPPDEG
jgi:hypothetical protein